ncbi:MAG TPA: phosphoribosylformylglycinamidine synthase subunit PurS [Elusimicrobiota bacterium]|nr:phosphoribosylformylglycinamidine synthase subunit PurS [Elusimicrobiota bacterium]
MSAAPAALSNGAARPAVSPRAAAVPYRVEVNLKRDMPDPEGARALSLLRAAGLSAVKEVRSAKIYSVRGPLTLSHVHQAAKELLCDAVTEEYKILSPQAPPSVARRTRVEVWFRPEVSDPAEDSIMLAFECAGLPKPVSARQGAVYYVEGRVAQAALEKAFARWLANPLICRLSAAPSA